MKLPTYLFIGLRYLQTSNKNSTFKTMIKICFISIFLGSCSLALIASIMKGFEQATYEKMQTIYPQIIIDAYNQELAIKKLYPILQDPQFNIQHFAPQQSQQVLLDNGLDDTPAVVQLRGIDPSLEKNVTPVNSMILPKNQTHYIEKLVQGNQVIVGKKLALNSEISTGSPIQILFTSQENFGRRNVRFQQKQALVTGIFETGIDEFDASLVYCSSNFFHEIFPEQGVTQIYAKLNPKVEEKQAIKKLHDTLHLHVYSWKDLYKAIVSALELEKYAMFLILLLIIIIASTNIISLLFMQIIQKRRDIAILVTLGLTKRKIRNIFLTLSMSIATVACTAGLITAYLIGIFLQNYRWIKLPDNVYYTTHLPVILDPLLFLSIFSVVLIISLFASIIPLKNIDNLQIATILRNET